MKLARQLVTAFCAKCDCELATELSTLLLKVSECLSINPEDLKQLLKAYCKDAKRHKARRLTSNLKELLQNSERLHGGCLVLREFRRLTAFAHAK